MGKVCVLKLQYARNPETERECLSHYVCKCSVLYIIAYFLSHPAMLIIGISFYYVIDFTYTSEKGCGGLDAQIPPHVTTYTALASNLTMILFTIQISP